MEEADNLKSGITKRINDIKVAARNYDKILYVLDVDVTANKTEIEATLK